VQLLITGGVGSKPNSATGRGILVNVRHWGIDINTGGAGSIFTNWSLNLLPGAF